MAMKIVSFAVSPARVCGKTFHISQNAGSAVLNPFEVAGSRVARPFRDAYGWFDSLFHARSDAKRGTIGFVLACRFKPICQVHRASLKTWMATSPACDDQ